MHRVGQHFGQIGFGCILRTPAEQSQLLCPFEVPPTTDAVDRLSPMALPVSSRNSRVASGCFSSIIKMSIRGSRRLPLARSATVRQIMIRSGFDTFDMLLNQLVSVPLDVSTQFLRCHTDRHVAARPTGEKGLFDTTQYDTTRSGAEWDETVCRSLAARDITRDDSRGITFRACLASIASTPILFPIRRKTANLNVRPLFWRRTLCPFTSYRRSCRPCHRPSPSTRTTGRKFVPTPAMPPLPPYRRTSDERLGRPA